MTIDDPAHRPEGSASMRVPTSGIEAVELPDLRFDLLCDMACRMFGMAAATIRVQGTSKVWHAAGLGSAAYAEQAAMIDAGDGSPVASIPFGDGGVGRFSLFGPSSRAFGADDRRQFEQFAALAEELLRLFELAQRALRRESDFRLLAEASTDTIIRGDLDGVRLYVSPAVEELLGYAPEELIGRRAIELTHPDDVPVFTALMREVRAGRLRGGRSEQRQRHKDGS